jgi:CO dehydrogenase/acetyl-CoA synthase alpha subunit
MITIEILRAAADKYRTALETGEVSDQLRYGLCWAVSIEIEPNTYLKKWDVAWRQFDSIYRDYGAKMPTEWDYLDKGGTDIDLHLRPRLEWLDEVIKRMEQEQIKETE